MGSSFVLALAALWLLAAAAPPKYTTFADLVWTNSGTAFTTTAGKTNNFLSYSSTALTYLFSSNHTIQINSSATPSGSIPLGDGTTAIGYSASSGSVGDYNTTVGYGAMFAVNGTENTAAGFEALDSSGPNNYCVMVGARSGVSLNAVDGVTGVGWSVFGNLTDGVENTAIGYKAGFTVDVGSSNTFVGYFADAAAANLTNVTAIGARVVAQNNNDFVLGNSLNRVRVPGTSTNAVLDVAGQLGLFKGTNYINFPVTNTPPASAVAPVRWVTVTADGTIYRMPLYQ